MRLNYFTLEKAIKVHDALIQDTGGLAGVKDLGPLQSVLEHIQNDDYYPLFEDKLSHLIFGLVQFHCFLDGNKRSSVALGAFFLELNGYDFLVTDFIRCMEDFVVLLAQGLLDRETFHAIITSICTLEDYPEWVKLELIEIEERS